MSVLILPFSLSCHCFPDFTQRFSVISPSCKILQTKTKTIFHKKTTSFNANLKTNFLLLQIFYTLYILYMNHQMYLLNLKYSTNLGFVHFCLSSQWVNFDREKQSQNERSLLDNTVVERKGFSGLKNCSDQQSTESFFEPFLERLICLFLQLP